MVLVDAAVVAIGLARRVLDFLPLGPEVLGYRGRVERPRRAIGEWVLRPCDDGA